MKTIMKVTATLIKWYLKATLWYWAIVGISFLSKEAADVINTGQKLSSLDLDNWAWDRTIENFKEYGRCFTK